MDTVLPLLVASVVFLVIGARASGRVRTLSDFLPIARSGGASVQSSRDFSASTVATTVSLATIVAAYFGLANYFGLWLLWTALTGAAGMFLVYIFAGRISAKLDQYSYKPSIHEFLATEYGSSVLKPVSGSLTVVGLLLLLATELLVGSRFLGDVIFGPGGGSWLLPVGLSIVAVTYVLLGGFNTVIRTDRLQMIVVWAMIPVMGIIVFLSGAGESSAKSVPPAFRPVDSGLLWFLLGIFLMNVPTHLSSMTVFQRVSACANREVLRWGLFRSSIGVLLSWSLLVVVAWLASRAGGTSGGEVLRNVLNGVDQPILKFVLMTGLYCAMLSTASTLLIAIGHTLTTDVLRRAEHRLNGESARSPEAAADEAARLRWSRVAIAISAAVACAVVAGLKRLGFQVEDLIFSIYGGALALFPPIVIALVSTRWRLRRIGRFAVASITVGFLMGWGIAFYGKIQGVQTAVFMSPAVGMVTSFCIIGVAFALRPDRSGADRSDAGVA